MVRKRQSPPTIDAFGHRSPQASRVYSCAMLTRHSPAKRIRPLRLLSIALLPMIVPGCANLPPSVTAVDPVEPTHSLAHDADSCAAGVERVGEQAKHSLDPNEIELLNWNIQKGGGADWGQDLRALGTDADVLTLQEAPLVNPGWKEHVIESFHAFAPGFTTPWTSTGVMTVSTAIPLVQCNLSAREPWLRTPKATLVTEYALDGEQETLLVVNIHAVNFTLGLGAFEAQLDGASRILARHEGPVIFAGDFNTWRQSRLTHLDSIIDEHGLASVQFPDDVRKRVFGLPLDHVYVRGLDVVDAETEETNSSDHNPMRVWLSIS